MEKEVMKFPIVFLPGLMCDSRLFQPQIDMLSGQRVIILAPVTGNSDVTGIASDLLDSLPNQFELIGLSFGGIVALEMIRLAPDRILRLVLLDTSYLSEPPHISQKRKTQIQAVQGGKLDEVMLHEHIPYYLADGSSSGPISDLCLTMAQEMGNLAFIAQSQALISRRDQTKTLKNIKIPTIIICGEHDRLCTVKTHTNMADLVKGSTLEIIPNTGHLPTLENPKITNRILKEWLN